MGINDLLPHVAGGKTYYFGIEKAGLKNCAVNLDAGGLCWSCAFQHSKEYLEGNYYPSVAAFQSVVTFLYTVLNWDLLVVLDGTDPPQKKFERERREKANEHAQSETDDAISSRISNTSTYILLCAKACRDNRFPYMIAKQEADMQVVKSRKEKDPWVVTGDSDILAYGHKKTIVVQSWQAGIEKFRIFDLTQHLTQHSNNNNQIIGEFPLMEYYFFFGVDVFIVWAAVQGCDVTENKRGILGLGKQRLMAAFASLKQEWLQQGKDASLVTATDFATALIQTASSRPGNYSLPELSSQIAYVKDCFQTLGLCYDKFGNVYKLDGTLVETTTACTVEHMMGSRDPKTESVLSSSQTKIVSKYKPSEALHSSGTESLAAAQLPANRASISQCTGEELKKMVLARGGSVTKDTGNKMLVSDLKAVATAYMELENEVPSRRLYHDRNPTTSGLFSNIDTNHKSKIPDILSGLIGHPHFSDHILRSFFQEIETLVAGNHFTTDLETIILEAPELSEETILRSFGHIGQSTTQKKSSVAYQRVLDMDELIYHAVADRVDATTKLHYFYVLAKIPASYKHDEKTRKETGPGERPLPNEYLAMVKFLVEPTTQSTHGHQLGKIAVIEQAYCALCNAGATGRCLHVAEACWVQHQIWGDGRPVEKPSTMALCAFLRKGVARNSDVTRPAVELVCQKLPKSPAEGAYRLEHGQKRNATEGMDVIYDVFGGDKEKRAKLESEFIFSMVRRDVQELYKELRHTLDENHRNDKPWEDQIDN